MVAEYPYTLGPPVAITQRAALMFCCCFFLFFFLFSSARDLRGLSADSHETLPRDRKWSKNWGPPKKFGCRKTCFFRRDFGRLRTSLANISGTEQDINNRKTACKLRSLSRLLTYGNLVNFGPQMAKNRTVVCAYPIAST